MNVTTGNIAELIAAIAIGRSLADAAQASDISVRTAQRRSHESEAALAINDARVDLTRQAVGALTALRELAFRRLREILGGDHAVPHVLRAAELVMRNLAAADAWIGITGDHRYTLAAVHAATTEGDRRCAGSVDERGGHIGQGPLRRRVGAPCRPR